LASAILVLPPSLVLADAEAQRIREAILERFRRAPRAEDLPFVFHQGAAVTPADGGYDVVIEGPECCAPAIAACPRSARSASMWRDNRDCRFDRAVLPGCLFFEFKRPYHIEAMVGRMRLSALACRGEMRRCPVCDRPGGFAQGHGLGPALEHADLFPWSDAETAQLSPLSDGLTVSLGDSHSIYTCEERSASAWDYRG